MGLFAGPSLSTPVLRNCPRQRNSRTPRTHAHAQIDASAKYKKRENV